MLLENLYHSTKIGPALSTGAVEKTKYISAVG